VALGLDGTVASLARGLVSAEAAGELRRGWRRAHGGSEVLHHAPSCFAAQTSSSLLMRALPPGTFRVRGALQPAALGTPAAHSATHAFTVQAAFVPSYDWQLLARGVEAVPPGMEVTLPLDGHTLKRARIPPVWRIQVRKRPPSMGTQRRRHARGWDSEREEHRSGRGSAKSKPGSLFLRG
jgi:hypothetical protein